MSIVNFTLPKTLEMRINEIIKEKGFSSKAEFFRFAAINFIDIINKPITSEDEKFDFLTDALDREISKRYTKKMPPLREQLADL